MEAFKTLDAGSSEFRSLEACQGSKIKDRGKDHYVKTKMPDKFRKEALDAHNKYRCLHQAAELKWSRSLEKEAQTWANQLAKEGCLKHDNTDDGENMYAVMGKGDVSGEEVVDRWYNEVDNYDFKNPGFKSGTGHFTQIVWQQSKELGIGKAKSDDGKIFVVARYRPAGNFMYQFQDNVKPKKSTTGSGEVKTGETRKITSQGGKGSFDGFTRDMKSSLNNETSKPSITRSSSTTADLPKQSLDAHNKFRSMHGVPALTWADDLATEAQAYAEKLASARKMQHASKSERKEAGENLAMFTGSFDTAGDKATTMWYDEVKDYDFSRGGWQSRTGHFTQVVWKGTKELGLGRAKTADGKLTFVVARYRPAGNIINFMAENVFPKSGH